MGRASISVRPIEPPQGCGGSAGIPRGGHASCGRAGRRRPERRRDPTLESTLEDNPTYYRAALRLAELYEQDRRYTDAADAYARAAAVNSRIDVSTQRAAALINAGKAAEARDILETSMKKSGTPDAVTLYMLGQSQRALKDFDAATATVQKLKSAYPTDARGGYLEALVLRDRGQYDQAIAALSW